MNRIAVLVLALLLPATLAEAQGVTFGAATYTKPISAMTEGELIDMWVVENGQCRGGHGDDPETWRACGRRDLLDLELDGRGWCYGRANEPATQNAWHRCGPDSIRLARP
ncbi:MAG: hypothetical protein AB7O56_11140 [Bauldia sp.]